MKQLISTADRWRTEYNPLRGLTIARVVSLFEAGQRGEFSNLQWAYKFAEETDSDLLALVERRTAALVEMDYNIKETRDDVRGYDAALAEDQAEALREAYERIDNLYEAIEHFEMAAFRGFAHVSPHSTAGEVTHLEPLDQWNFVRDGLYGAWYWNPTAREANHVSLGEGARLKPEDLITMEARRHIDRLGLLKFVRANLSEKDWDSFIEIYGIPGGIVIGPPDVPQGKEQEYQDAAERAARGASGYLPHGADMKFPTEARGSQPFEPRLEYLSKKLILAGTGGMLTMLAESGSGTLAGGAHSETFQAIARARAQKISALFQRRIDKPLLAKRFPGKPALAYFDLAAEESQDVGKIIDQVKGLEEAGYELDPEDVAERTGYRIVRRVGIPAQAAPAQNVPNREAPAKTEDVDAKAATVEKQLLGNALAQALQADQTDTRVLAVRLRELLEIAESDDPERLTLAMRNFREDLPDLARTLLANPSLADAIESALGAATANGLAEGTQRTEPNA